MHIDNVQACIVYEGIKNIKSNAHRHWGMYEMFPDMAVSRLTGIGSQASEILKFKYVATYNPPVNTKHGCCGKMSSAIAEQQVTK